MEGAILLSLDIWTSWIGPKQSGLENGETINDIKINVGTSGKVRQVEFGFL